MTDSFCALPFLSVSMDGQGRSRLCCNSRGHFADETISITQAQQAHDMRDTPLHRSVRLSMRKQERHDACTKCWTIEDTGGNSFRKIWNQILAAEPSQLLPQMSAAGGLDPQVPVRYMDITWGNKCNLTCRMCNWYNSHLWLVDLAKLGRSPPAEDIRPQDWFEHAQCQSLLNSMLETVTHVNLLGGEPLIVKQHMHLLEQCVASGRSQHINLSYNTNLTHLPETLLALWHDFAHVNINVSLEAVGRANDYIRQNSRWEDIEANLRSLLGCRRSGANLTVSLHTTFGVYNAHVLQELVVWSDSQEVFGGVLPFVNTVYHPSWQDARVFPWPIKQDIRHRVLRFLAGREEDHNHSSWISAINHMSRPIGTTAAPEDWPKDPWAQFWHEADELDRLKHRRMTDHLQELSRLRPWTS
jgi:molybdenum cofactor biosynthesis enzyme MoaA